MFVYKVSKSFLMIPYDKGILVVFIYLFILILETLNGDVKPSALHPGLVYYRCVGCLSKS